MAPCLVENQGLQQAKQQRPPLGVRKDAVPTSPPSKPTIRVIHIFAPKVIKTDMANFRATVQKLTGRSTRKSRAQSRSEVTAPVAPPPPAQVHHHHQPAAAAEDLILHRLVGDACGPLARSTSTDSSSTYSCDSSRRDTSFSFYVPAHRESAYSLSEIPAPFFGTDTTSSMVTPTSYDLQHFPPPHLSMDPAGLLSSFNVDSLGFGLGSPLPLPEHSIGACDVPFLYLEIVAPRPLGAGCMIC